MVRENRTINPRFCVGALGLVAKPHINLKRTPPRLITRNEGLFSAVPKNARSHS